MNNWFTVKVKYNKGFKEDPESDVEKFKMTTENYLLKAENFTDAEAKAYEEIGSKCNGEFNVLSISRIDFVDIFNSDDADYWYKCKISYEDEFNGKVKKYTGIYIAAGNSVKEADARLKEGLKDLTFDFEVLSVILMPVVDIIQDIKSNATVSI